MTTWEKILAVLDQTFGYADIVLSKVTILESGFDHETKEHITRFEYRVRVGNNQPPTPDPSISFQSERIKLKPGDRLIDSILDTVLSDYRKRS